MNITETASAGTERLVVAGLVLMLSACSNGSTAVDPATGAPPADVTELFRLPAPLDTPRMAGAAGVDEEVNGAAFMLDLNDNFHVEATSGVFSPDWPVDGGGPYVLSYAVYQFQVTPPDGFVSLALDWQSLPACHFIGLSDYTRNRWEWQECSGSVDLPADLTPYLDSGFMLVAVAATGTGPYALDTLTLEADSSGGHGLTNMFFLHHSVGDGITQQGNIRGQINAYNTANGTSFEFWDHCYSWIGLRGPDGVFRPEGEWYNGMVDNTDPGDLHLLWTSTEFDWTELRTQILSNHEVIAFKSCYPASGIGDAGELQQRKDWYLAMRDVFDTHPNKLFIVMSTPPLNPAGTSVDDASRARQFAEWLKSAEYVDGHPNVVCFDLFTELAEPDDGSGDANMLKVIYREGSDSHPNHAGYTAVGPVFANFLCTAAAAY